MMSYVLGVDLGTSSLKGILINKNGGVVSEESESYGVISEQAGYSEQNPQEWINAFNKVILKIIKRMPEVQNKLEAISISGQMHSLVLVDEKGESLRNSILWNDVRTTKECEIIKNSFGEQVLDITKNRPLEGFTLPKILWVQNNEPEIWNKVHKILLPKDYLRYYLTNTFEMDYSDAAGTLLLDLQSLEWSKEILEKFNISKDLMPRLVESTEVTGKLNERLRKKFNFSNKVSIVAGGADNACAALGAGVTKSDVGLSSIGTSGVFLAPEKESTVSYEGDLHFFNHVIPNKYYSMGVTLAAGKSLDWFKHNFAPNTSYEELIADTDEVSIGSEGLIFTPYISGERTPYFDSKIRGSFLGIDSRHMLNHFTRSVLEGITFSLKDSLKLHQSKGSKEFTSIISVGGGAKSSIWLQMQADIFNIPVYTLETEQGPGYGAAMLAAVGGGWYTPLGECAENFIKYKDEYLPIEENVNKYQAVYEIYEQIYGETKNISHKILESIN